MSSPSEEDGRRPEPELRSLEDEFWSLKARTTRAESAKKSLMLVKEAIGTGLSLTSYEADGGFRAEIRDQMDALDWDAAEAANWIAKGWGFAEWEEVASMKVLDDFHAILAEVQSFLVAQGTIEDIVETVEDVLEDELLRQLKEDLDGRGEE